MSIAGHWVGDARLFDKAVRAKTTPLPIEIRIEEDLAMSGSIGNARIPRSVPVSVKPPRIEYHVALEGSIRDLPQLKKSHMIVIVTRNAKDDLDADFHLKSRFGFDPTMQVGHMEVKRAKE
ncbi:MAG: hypothetical protein WCV99_13665 [Sterolibacterium sp.]|jgi:hypothetical protein